MLRAGYGDVEAAFAAAHAIVALDLAIGRHSAVPIGTRGALARLGTVSGKRSPTPTLRRMTAMG